MHVDCFPLTSDCKILNTGENAFGIIIVAFGSVIRKGSGKIKYISAQLSSQTNNIFILFRYLNYY